MKDELLNFWNKFTERCGYVLRDGTIIEIPNNSRNPRRSFKMDLDDLITAFRNHNPRNVVGIFHTHPSNSPKPSREDIAGWPSESIKYWIVTENAVYEWAKDVSGSVRLVGNGPTLAAQVYSLAEYKRQRDFGNSRKSL